MKFERKQAEFVPPPVEYVLTLTEQEAKWLERVANDLTNEVYDDPGQYDFFWALYNELPYGGEDY